jgi:hypothetical protein
MERWRDGEMERWRDGERWREMERDGERWRDGALWEGGIFGWQFHKESGKASKVPKQFHLYLLCEFEDMRGMLTGMKVIKQLRNSSLEIFDMLSEIFLIIKVKLIIKIK